MKFGRPTVPLEANTPASPLTDCPPRRTEALGQLAPARLGSHSANDISYRGVKLPRVSGVSGGFSCGAERVCRRGPCWLPGNLPMLARHEYRAWAGHKWAVRVAARLWSGE